MSFNWNRFDEEDLHRHGWPLGINSETVLWLRESISKILSETVRPLKTFEVYEALRAERFRKTAPDLWGKATVMDFLYSAVERALGDLGAQQAWVPPAPFDDPFVLLKRSRRDELTSVEGGRIFVAGSVGRKGKTATYCPDCIPDKLKKKLGEDYVDTWEEFSDGWVSAPICDNCHTAIRVVVNMDKTGRPLYLVD